MAAGGGSGAGQGGANAQCCGLGDKPSCSGDGHTIKSCLPNPGGSCSSSGIYAYVWMTNECPNGCQVVGESGAGGGSSFAQCK